MLMTSEWMQEQGLQIDGEKWKEQEITGEVLAVLKVGAMEKGLGIKKKTHREVLKRFIDEWKANGVPMKLIGLGGGAPDAKPEP